MERIKKITLKVNENAKVFYEYEGERFDDAYEVLQKVFYDQGELYEKIFNVDRETAELAGWGPDHKIFNNTSYGWRQFIKDQGKIRKEEIIEEFNLEEFVHNYVGF